VLIYRTSICLLHRNVRQSPEVQRICEETPKNNDKSNSEDTEFIVENIHPCPSGAGDSADVNWYYEKENEKKCKKKKKKDERANKKKVVSIK
jgi:hypothetical protein